LGEFVGDQEPEFQGAIERAVAWKADAWDSAQNVVLEGVLFFRGGSRFEGKEGREQAGGETFGERERGGQGGEIY